VIKFNAVKRVSKNAITIDQLKLACRHVEEMRAVGVTENLAIRTLESITDVYAKLHMGGTAVPNHVDEVPQKRWSVAALSLRGTTPTPRLRVEHGTPQREFARKILDLHKKDELNATAMNELVERHWRLAVITLDEDQRLNKVARSKMSDTPEERWKKAGIEFPPDSAT
jgi:hypothetical protein